jgi:hypothetical protein
MRHLLVPACLFVCAWAQPADPVLEFLPTSADNASVIPKTESIRLETFGSAPAETTDDVMEQDSDTVASLSDGTDEVLIGDVDETGFIIAFEVPVPYERPVPLPPRRAIPHQLVCAALADAAIDNDLPTPFLIRLIWQESRFRQNVVSPVGAQGVAQFMPETAAQRGLDDPFDPLQAVRASAQLLRDLFKQFGNLGLAAAAYNAGPKRVQDWLAKRSTLPQETRDYVQHITGAAAESWKGKPVALQMRVPAQVPCQHEAGLFAANGPAEIPLPPIAKIPTKPDDKTRLAAKTESKAEPKAETKTEPTSEGKATQSKNAVAKADKVKTAKTDTKPATMKAAKAETRKAAVKTASAKPAPAKTQQAATKTASARSKPDKSKSVKVASAHK